MPSLYLILREQINKRALDLVGRGWEDFSDEVALVGRNTFDRRFRLTRHHTIAFWQATRAMRIYLNARADP